MPSLAQVKVELARGKSRGLVEQCLARIADQSGEGGRVFLKVHAADALAAADFYDRVRARGAAASPFAGIPVSIKDLFDIAGDVTTAGSVALRDAKAAEHDAPAVARLRAAGFIPIGRTNMTEFAFSGLGINPHYGTPPSSGTRACVGLKPTMPLKAAGIRHEPPVSVPSAPWAMPSATDTAPPDDEPPGTWPTLRFQTLFGVP